LAYNQEDWQAMNISDLKLDLDLEPITAGMVELMTELYPICRSITGNGVRQTLQGIGNRIPLVIHEVPTGTPVFDWTVPKEWNIRDAYVKNCRGDRVIDFQRSNLHVVNYSVPVHQTMSLAELKTHLHTLPDHPDWVPYRSSYYKETWGFCLSHRQMLALEEGEYEVCIDASLEPGSLTYGEYYLPGDQAEEVLISCHVCHPSLANDNLSGIAIATLLAQTLAQVSRRYSYRFVFLPVTIGAITWLSRNEAQVPRIKHGLVLSCLGDPGHSTYKKSRRGDAAVDRAVQHVLSHSGQPYDVIDFLPYGYDERQYCSPGFNLAIGCLMRTPNGKFPQYHTSADNLEFVQPSALTDSFSKCLSVLGILEADRIYLNQNPKCEPQLGKRGLYRSIGGSAGTGLNELAMLWTLNLSDGQHSLLDIAEHSGFRFDDIYRVANLLIEHNLLKELSVSTELPTDKATLIADG
jgi:aminopeptidase-like protein